MGFSFSGLPLLLKKPLNDMEMRFSSCSGWTVFAVVRKLRFYDPLFGGLTAAPELWALVGSVGKGCKGGRKTENDRQLQHGGVNSGGGNIYKCKNSPCAIYVTVLPHLDISVKCDAFVSHFVSFYYKLIKQTSFLVSSGFKEA